MTEPEAGFVRAVAFSILADSKVTRLEHALKIRPFCQISSLFVGKRTGNHLPICFNQAEVSVFGIDLGHARKKLSVFTKVTAACLGQTGQCAQMLSGGFNQPKFSCCG